MESDKSTLLIAPCGMNCGLCMAYLREKNKCPGCWGEDRQKKVTCLRCRIKNCPVIVEKGGFCFSCGEYPCPRLNHLDKRYRAKYHMSMIENLEMIKGAGLAVFLGRQKERWTCPACGGVICVHRGACHDCGKTFF